MGRPDCSGLTSHQVVTYILTNIIGFGAAGTVYHAVDTASMCHKFFAAKCLPKKKISHRRRYQLSGENINHDAVTGCSYVLQLCDIIEEDFFFFLVLDLCKTDMYKAIWKRKVSCKNDAPVKQAFIKTVDGVIACHRHGVYHRDLKPQNIIISCVEQMGRESGLVISDWRPTAVSVATADAVRPVI